MIDFLYHRRFTVFLISFMIMLFGGMVFPDSIREEGEIMLLIQNMICSALLFLKQSKREKIVVVLIIFLGIIVRLNQHYLQQSGSLIFVGVYIIYFVIISYRLFHDLIKQKIVGIETISAVFSGFILLGVVASIIFLVIDNTLNGAFEGSVNSRDFSDFLYFGFVTLLSIGYGDITPSLEISKKLVVLFGLIGHFYTVFVTAIIIGKFIGKIKDI